MTTHVTVTLLEADIEPLIRLLGIEEMCTLGNQHAARLQRIIRALHERLPDNTHQETV